MELPDWDKIFGEMCDASEQEQPNLVRGLRQAVHRRGVTAQLGINVIAWATADEAARELPEEGAA